MTTLDLITRAEFIYKKCGCAPLAPAPGGCTRAPREGLTPRCLPQLRRHAPAPPGTPSIWTRRRIGTGR
jgi:hypothetical protein